MTSGLTWLKSFLHFIAALNTSWLLTSGKRSRRARKFMLSIAFCEAFLELVLHWAIHKSFLDNFGIAQTLSTMRKGSFAAGVISYLVSIVSTFFLPQKENISKPAISRDLPVRKEDWEGAYLELVAEFNRAAEETKKEIAKRDALLIDSLHHTTNSNKKELNRAAPFFIPSQLVRTAVASNAQPSGLHTTQLLQNTMLHRYGVVPSGHEVSLGDEEDRAKMKTTSKISDDASHSSFLSCDEFSALDPNCYKVIAEIPNFARNSINPNSTLLRAVGTHPKRKKRSGCGTSGVPDYPGNRKRQKSRKEN